MSRSRRGNHSRRSTRVKSAKHGVSAEALIAEALDAQRRNRVEEAERYYHQASVKIGNQAQFVLTKAQQIEQAGLSESAILLLSAWVRCFDGPPIVRLYLANLLFQEAQTEEALELAGAVLSESSSVAAGCLAALCCEHLDRLDDAKEYVDSALRINGDDPQANITKAHVDFKSGDYEAAVQRLEKVIEYGHMNAQLRSKAWHEIGMALDRMGESDRAFDAFTKCGEATQETGEYKSLDINRPLMLISQYRKVCSPEWLDCVPAVTELGVDDDTPQIVFLIGFPRSGTTMTEQILCAHKMIRSADERPYLHETRQEARRMTNAGNDAGVMLSRLTKDHIIRLRKSYFHRITVGVVGGMGGVGGTEESERNEEASATSSRASSMVLIDKLPLNLLDLPFILHVFPDCRIIMALRDPRDVCLSCFMQDFRLNSEMAHFVSLSGAARFYEKVMSFYLELRPMITVPIMEVRYEDTVTDLSAQSRRLTEFLGVPWEEGMLRFHEQARRRNISTPSYEAVRKPINSKAVARWKRYEGYFEDVSRYLQSFISAFGYDK